MVDLLWIGLLLLFFIASFAYVWGCTKLISGKET